MRRSRTAAVGAADGRRSFVSVTTCSAIASGTALDVVGDRWALLVVRELLLGPLRFTDLARGLTGIGTDVLTARLRALEEGGVVRRDGEGRQQRYALTERGRGLRPVLAELARWGADRLGLPRSTDEISPRVALTSMVLDAPRLPRSVNGTYMVQFDADTVVLRVDNGRIELDAAPDERRAAVELTHSGALGLIIGTAADELVERGEIAVLGDRQAAVKLLDGIAAPNVLAGLLAARAAAARRARH